MKKMGFVTIGLVVLLASGYANAGIVCQVLQDTYDYYHYNDGSKQTTNYGSAEELKFGRNSYGGTIREAIHIQFDLSPLSSYSADDIVSAKMKLYLFEVYASHNGHYWYAKAWRFLPNRDWVESEDTWIQYKNGYNWDWGGGTHPGVDVAGTPEDAVNMDDYVSETGTTHPNVWVEWDITDAVKAWLGGETNRGINIFDGSIELQWYSYVAKFYSSEATGDGANYHPYLDVEVVPEPTMIGLLILGCGLLRRRK